MEKKTNKAKWEIFTLSEKNQLNRKAIAFDKISRNFALYGISINRHLLGYFCDAEFISAMKTVQNSYGFHENAKIIENHSFLLIVWNFHWNSWTDCHKKSSNIIFRWKRRQKKQN